MARLEPWQPTQAFIEAYAKADSALRVQQCRLYYILALVLVPACSGLDYFVYPHLVGRIFIGRMLCDLVMLPFFLSIFTDWGKRHIVPLSKFPPLAPCITICWMIYATEGVLSPYYAGINVVVVGVILLIPYTLKEAGLICAIVVVSYGVACLMHRLSPPAMVHAIADMTENRRSLINNIYFFGMTTVIALTSSHYSAKRRMEEFRLRFELDKNNRELAATLVKLQETEVQLVQSEKMNALGKLSAGLLHEINNPLNFTFMALQIAEQEATGNDGLRDTLKDIGEGMGRIRTVISDLRAFAYPTQQVDTEEFLVEEALITALRLTAHELNAVVVERDAIAGVRALGSATQIVHVFMNLLVNSAHAIRSADRGEAGRIRVSCASSADRLTVKVRDNGIGVSPTNLPKLLDPFFTTKAPGEGLGLGLSICHTIVKNHGGAIHIDTEAGQWTEVSFDLPLPLAKRSAA